MVHQHVDHMDCENILMRRIPNQNSMEAMQGQRQLALVKTMLETAKGNYYQRISYLQVRHTRGHEHVPSIADIR